MVRIRTLRMVLFSIVVLSILSPAATSAGELRLASGFVRFSALDGSANDDDGVADGTLTLDRLELGGTAEILVDQPAARFVVAGDAQFFGRSAIRPLANMPAQGPQIEIRAGSIRLFGRASLRADGRNSGGSLSLCASGNIEVRDRARIFARALDGTGPGGTVHLEAGGRLLLENAEVVVNASGGRGGSVTLVSCGKGSRGLPSSDAAIVVRGSIDASGSIADGGSVKVEARQGSVDFRRSHSEANGLRQESPLAVINANGATRQGGIVVAAATSVVPGKPLMQPAATVVTGAHSNATCGCSTGNAADTTVVVIGVDRTSGVPGTTFELSGRVIESASPVEQWRWKFTDGRELTGQTVRVSFTSPGLYGVELTATDRNGETAQDETGLQVFDPDTQAPPELGLPPQVGDVDGDGLITLRDAHRAAKHAGGLEPLPATAASAADIDLDGEVNLGDAVLLGQAVAAGQPLPNVLSPDRGVPGARVNLISPELLDAAAKIEIEVGEAVWVQEPLRPARGYATFIIPFDATRRGSFTVTPGPVEVRIRRDGTVVETFVFQIEEPPSLPSDPKSELLTLLDDQLELLELNQEAIRTLLELTAVNADQKELLLAAFAVAREDAAARTAKLRAQLEAPGGEELAQLFFRFANAAGYPEYRQQLTEFLTGDGAERLAQIQLRAVAAANPQSVDDVLEILCMVKDIAERLDTGGEILSWACDAMLVAALVTVLLPEPFLDVPALLAWAGACGTVEAAIEMALLVNSMVASIDPDLRFEASPENPRSGEPVTLKAEVELVGIDDLCGFAAGQTRDELIEELAEESIERLLRRKLALRSLSKVVALLSEDLLEELEDRLEESVARAVSHTDIADALEEFASEVCALFNLGAPLPDDLERILQGPEPNVGTLRYPGDGTAEYRCPENSTTAEVLFTATRDICDKQVTRRVTVTCSNRPVTITIGDNGNLNDDIYEVRVQGKTVLTSSQPVRSISTIVDLPAGDHEVRMIGRAAPDGIGTYFIQFSGATVIGGDPLSGTDLTPGVTKTFLIRVQ